MGKRVTIGQKDADPIEITVSEDEVAREYEGMVFDPETPHVLWVNVKDA